MSAVRTSAAAWKAQKAFDNLLSLPRSEWPTAVNKLPHATQRELLKLISERDKSGKRSIASPKELPLSSNHPSEIPRVYDSNAHPRTRRTARNQARGKLKVGNTSILGDREGTSAASTAESQMPYTAVACVDGATAGFALDTQNCAAGSTPMAVPGSIKSTEVVNKCEQQPGTAAAGTGHDFSNKTSTRRLSVRESEASKELCCSDSSAFVTSQGSADTRVGSIPSSGNAAVPASLIEAGDVSVPTNCEYCKEIVVHLMFVAGDSELADESACEVVYGYIVFWLVVMFQKVIESMCVLTTIKHQRTCGRRKRPLFPTWYVQDATAVIRKLLVYMFPAECQRYADRENIYRKLHERVQRQMSRGTGGIYTATKNESEFSGTYDRKEDADELFHSVVNKLGIRRQPENSVLYPLDRFERRLDFADVRTAAMQPVQYRRYCKSREASFIKSRSTFESLLSRCAAAAMLNIQRLSAERKHPVFTGNEFCLPTSRKVYLPVSRSVHRILAFLIADKVATHVELALRIRKAKRDSTVQLTNISATALPSFADLIGDIRRCTTPPVAPSSQEFGFASSWFTTRSDPKYYIEAAALMYESMDAPLFQLHGAYSTLGLRAANDCMRIDELAEWATSKKAAAGRYRLQQQDEAEDLEERGARTYEERAARTSGADESVEPPTTSVNEANSAFEAICREAMTQCPDVVEPECPSEFGLFFYVGSRDPLTSGLREGRTIEEVALQMRRLYDFHKTNKTKQYIEHQKHVAMFKQYGSTLRKVLAVQRYINSLECEEDAAVPLTEKVPEIAVQGQRSKPHGVEADARDEGTCSDASGSNLSTSSLQSGRLSTDDSEVGEDGR